MLKFAADENFDGRVVRGLRRRQPDLDIVRVQDTDIAGSADPAVLRWAALEGRVLLTHDVETMTRFAYERVRRGDAMPGIFEVRRGLPPGRVIEELLILAVCSAEGEWEGQVRYLPL